MIFLWNGPVVFTIGRWALATFALSRQEEGTPGGSFLEPGYGYLIHLPASLPTGQTSLNIRYTDYLTRLGSIESQRP